jgi:hypothetical protein
MRMPGVQRKLDAMSIKEEDKPHETSRLSLL